MTKEFLLLGPGGVNMPLVPRGAGVAVEPITLPPNDLEGGSVTVGVGAEAWALPMEGFGAKRVPLGVVAVAVRVGSSSNGSGVIVRRGGGRS